jgi:hypothetical protein
MAQVPTPSSVIISDPSTLVQNFTENAGKVYCQAASDAGRLAILGFASGAGEVVPQALIGLGALAVLGAATCQSAYDPSQIVPEPPPFTGGQCATNYSVTYRVRLVNIDSCAVVYDATGTDTVMGPVSFDTIATGVTGGTSCGGGPRQVPQMRWRLKNGSGGVVNSVDYFDVAPSGVTIQSVTRIDGQPDNCGNIPGGGGQIITNIDEGDTIDNSTVTDNSRTTYVAQTTFNFSGSQFTVNMPFSNIKVDSLLPLNFSIEIGGVRFGFGQDPNDPTNPTLHPRPTNPNPVDPAKPETSYDDLKELLNQIKDCVCQPDVDLDMLFLPYVDAASSCDVETATLLVPKGSVSENLVQAFNNSAVLASTKCEENAIVQKPRTLIYAATTLPGGGELFTGDIASEVRSLVIVITAIDNPSLRIIDLYPDAKQRKFGSVSFVLSDVNGGGDYIYIFDTESFVPLPKRGKPGRLRILMKPGISFSVYDSGERY